MLVDNPFIPSAMSPQLHNVCSHPDAAAGRQAGERPGCSACFPSAAADFLPSLNDLALKKPSEEREQPARQPATNPRQARS